MRSASASIVSVETEQTCRWRLFESGLMAVVVFYFIFLKVLSFIFLLSMMMVLSLASESDFEVRVIRNWQVIMCALWGRTVVEFCQIYRV